MLLEVITPHRSNYPNPISFKIGDVLVLGKEDDEYPGWIRVKTRDGNEGWAPKQYIDSSVQPAVANENYSARELDTEPGDILELIYRLNDWVWVRNAAGSLGWIPEESIIEYDER